jgi:hypothetical protein
MCLSRIIIHYQYVSTAVATIIKATNQNIGDSNNLSKYLSEPLRVTKKVSDFLYSHRVSAYLPLKPDRIKLKNTLKLGVFLYVVSVTPCNENENRAAVNVGHSVSYHFTQIQLLVYDTGRHFYSCVICSFHYRVYNYVEKYTQFLCSKNGILSGFSSK